MKEYLKPFIEDEDIELEDVIAASTDDIGRGGVNDGLDDTNEDISPWPWK